MKTNLPIQGYKGKRSMCLLAAAGIAAVGATSALAEEASKNSVDFTLGGFQIHGDDAAFQRRFGNNGDFYGGISNFHYEQAVGDDLFTADGHAAFGMDDYELDMTYTRDGLGYLNAGYRQFRTWYDPSGGIETVLSNSPMELDRGEVWLEAGLRKEDLPEVTFGYVHRWRDGQKDSTIWSTAQLPSFSNINESSDIFMLDVSHRISETDLDLSLRYQIDNVDNDRRVANQAVTEARDLIESELFSSSLSSQTQFNERMLMSFAYMYTTMDTDLNGSIHDENRFIFGGTNFSQNVATANFWWNPVDDLVVVPSVRAEWQNITGTSFTRDPLGVLVTNGSQNSGIDALDVTEELEVRYSGIENVLVYSRFEWTQGDKDSHQFEAGRNGGVPRTVDVDTDAGKYILGTNYYPTSGVSLSAQYYYQQSDREYDSNDTGTQKDLGAQILQHDSDTNDLNLRLTWRALPNLTLVTRYDYQQTEIENQTEVGNPLVALDLIESADIISHILSQSATWMPVERCYIQASFSYVLAETNTPADVSNPAVIHDSDNDYVTASLTTGYAIDDKTDITAGYSFYRSDNYSGFAGGVLGFGTDIEEHVFSVSLNRRISPNMIWNLGYAYYTSNDGVSNGINDYDAQMVSSGLQVRF